MLEFAVPELVKVVSERKNLKTAAKIVGRQTLMKQVLGGGKQEEVIQEKVRNKTVGHTKTFLPLLDIERDRSKEVSAPTFCCTF